MFAASASIRDYTFVVGTDVNAGPFPAATDADDDIDTYSILPEPPDGVEFVDSVRRLVGNPTTAQESTEYTYTVTDEAGGTADLTFNITVVETPVVEPPPVDGEDTTPPTFTATAPTTPITIATVVKLTFNEALRADPTLTGNPTAELAKYTATVVRVADEDAYNVTITPTPAADLTADVPETVVTFTVAATDAAGNDIAAANSTFDVTLAKRTADEDPDALPAPTNVVATPSTTDGTVGVTWDWTGDTAQMAALEGFTVSWAYNPEVDADVAIVAADARVYTIPADMLMAGLETTVSVMANATTASGLASSGAAMPAAGPVTPLAIPDTTSPTVMVEVLSKDANGKHMVDAAGTVRFGLTFSEPLWKEAGPNLFEVADFFITNHRNQFILQGVTLSPPKDTGIPATTGPGNQEMYTLTVPAIYPDPVGRYGEQVGQEVLIELLGFDVLGGQVADTKGNKLLKPASSKFDTIPPKVEITPGYFNANGVFVAASTGEPMRKLAFEFAFTEELSPGFTTTDIQRSVSGDNFELLADSAPKRVSPTRTKPYAFTVIATTIDINKATTVLIKREGVSDAAKNLLQADTRATYTPATTAPVATITAPDIFNCGIDGNSVTVTITDNEAIGSGEGIAAGEITVSTGWQIRTGSFSASKTAKSATARFNVVRKDVENGADRSWLGIQEVTVTVAADAVKDDTNQGNAAKSETNTAGPVITVPAGQYVVVIRDNAWRTSHLNFVRTLYLGDYNVRAENVQVQTWDCMPDLGLIFDVTVDASPGIGGGGLMVLQSRDHKDTANPTIAKGTVGISEIMWSEDRGYRSVLHLISSMHESSGLNFTIPILSTLKLRCLS